MAKQTTSLAIQAYEKIKTNILNLTYPPGSPLTEIQLTEELKMSRSPVRSAIKMLETEGLILTDYHKSMIVKEITRQDIIEIYQLREVIEGSAFRMIFDVDKAREYSYRIEEKVVRMCAAEDNLFEWELADTKMHMEIISIYNNRRIERIYENNLSELIRMGHYSVQNGMMVEHTNNNLKKMVSYMRSNNYQKAFEILRDEHFIIGQRSALKTFTT